MPQSDDSLSLSDIARELAVERQTVQLWHRARIRGNRPPRVSSPLKAVAEAMGVPVPEAEGSRPRYPRSVVTAFAKAVGYLDAEGHRVELPTGRGRWLPANPTVDPASGRELRLYTTHVAALLKILPESLNVRRNRGHFPEPDGWDELGRPFWFEATVKDVSGRNL